MLSNNLDVMNLAILEHQELLRRHSNRFVVVDRTPASFRTILQSVATRFFGLFGGESAKRDQVTTIPAGASLDRPEPLTLIHLPPSVADEAIDRAA